MLGSALLLAPLAARAGSERKEHGNISITYDGQFNRAHGVRSGRGTPRDPYVISGWSIGNLSIKDTTKAVRIVDNTIWGTLTLNWIGENVTVRKNDIGDLRVNENVARWGDPTSGTIKDNSFAIVGQLRHFDGRFEHNKVGFPGGGLGSSYPDVQAVNFDGFNGAHFSHNTIYGYVDARLHGHHHSSGFGRPSHMHAAGPHDGGKTDHARRWHEVMITKNRIYTAHSYALAYLDTNHSDNDRTANSETNPYLNAPHVHRTRAHIMNNRLVGAGILIDVFNATDRRHRKAARRGTVHIESNKVTIENGNVWPFDVRYGIEVRDARDLKLRIEDNTILAPAPVVDVPGPTNLQAQGAGILLQRLQRATVSIIGDRVSNRQFGVHASSMSESVQWTVKGLVTDGVDEPVSYDESVKNRPRRR